MSLKMPEQPQDDPHGEYFAQLYINSPQIIKGKLSDDCIVLRKQDIAIKIPLEDVEIVSEVLKWVSVTGLLRMEADQARDLLQLLARECEGR